MKNPLTRAYIWMQMWKDENGQDLVEYALVVALVAFAAVAGMSDLAVKINSAFSAIGSKLTSAMTSA